MKQKCHKIVISTYKMGIMSENNYAVKSSIFLLKELFATYMHKSFQNKLKITTTLGRRLIRLINKI